LGDIALGGGEKRRQQTWFERERTHWERKSLSQGVLITFNGLPKGGKGNEALIYPAVERMRGMGWGSEAKLIRKRALQKGKGGTDAISRLDQQNVARGGVRIMNLKNKLLLQNEHMIGPGKKEGKAVENEKVKKMWGSVFSIKQLAHGESRVLCGTGRKKRKSHSSINEKAAKKTPTMTERQNPGTLAD